MSVNIPKTPAGAIVNLVISVIVAIICFGMGFIQIIVPRITHKDWVPVMIQQHDEDCISYRRCGKGGCHDVQECIIEYQYTWNGTEYSGQTEHFMPASHDETEEAYIDPNNPGEPVEFPSLWFMLIYIVLTLFALAFVWLFASLYKAYKDLEKINAINSQ